MSSSKMVSWIGTLLYPILTSKQAKKAEEGNPKSLILFTTAMEFLIEYLESVKISVVFEPVTYLNIDTNGA